MPEHTEAALLLWREGDEIKGQWTLARAVTTIGRWEDNDLVIQDRWVSRHHAEVRHEKDQYFLHDLGSKNGTLVNGRRITAPRTLADGDEIQFTQSAVNFEDLLGQFIFSQGGAE